MDKYNLEEAMARLDEIVKILENNNETLENSIELFKEGMDLSKFCSTQLDGFEQQVLEILKMDKEGK